MRGRESRRPGLAAAILAMALGGGPADAAPQPRTILAEMKTAVDRTPAYRCQQRKRELFGERMAPEQILLVKYWGGRIYLRVVAGPMTGAEVLYVPTWNRSKVLIHKGSFPDLTLTLDRHGSLMMTNQHHSIEDAGFEQLAAGLLDRVRRAHEAGEAELRYRGEAQIQGRLADVVEISTPPRIAGRYTVGRGEDIWQIAQRLRVDPYYLLHSNGLKHVSVGTELQVPAYYGTRTVLAVDRQHRLPSQLEIYDGKGQLYEFYEWSQCDAGPLSELDFSRENPAYRF